MYYGKQRFDSRELEAPYLTSLAYKLSELVFSEVTNPLQVDTQHFACTSSIFSYVVTATDYTSGILINSSLALESLTALPSFVCKFRSISYSTWFCLSVTLFSAQAMITGSVLH